MRNIVEEKIKKDIEGKDEDKRSYFIERVEKRKGNVIDWVKERRFNEKNYRKKNDWRNGRNEWIWEGR